MFFTDSLQYKNPFNIYLSPLKKGNPFSLRHVNHDGARMDNMNTHLTRERRTAHGERRETSDGTHL